MAAFSPRTTRSTGDVDETIDQKERIEETMRRDTICLVDVGKHEEDIARHDTEDKYNREETNPTRDCAGFEMFLSFEQTPEDKAAAQCTHDDTVGVRNDRCGERDQLAL